MFGFGGLFDLLPALLAAVLGIDFVGFFRSILAVIFGTAA